MSEISTPAGQTGGNPNLADLPDKIRVHALAKLLERSSREVLDALTELGEDGRSAQSSINRDVAIKVGEILLGAPEAADGEGPADASNLILLMIAPNLGSLRSESTTGCTRRYAAQPRRSSTARSIQSRAFSFSPSAM